MTAAEAGHIIAGILTALEYSHEAGVVHRDIKPGNVMVTRSGQVKVMDFGIARAISDSSATVAQTTAILGTAQYFSPEQAKGETVDPRSDLYSTGIVLFEMLTGRAPFRGDSPIAVAYQHVSEPRRRRRHAEPQGHRGHGRRRAARAREGQEPPLPVGGGVPARTWRRSSPAAHPSPGSRDRSGHATSSAARRRDARGHRAAARVRRLRARDAPRAGPRSPGSGPACSASPSSCSPSPLWVLQRSSTGGFGADQRDGARPVSPGRRRRARSARARRARPAPARAPHVRGEPGARRGRSSAPSPGGRHRGAAGDTVDGVGLDRDAEGRPCRRCRA